MDFINPSLFHLVPLDSGCPKLDLQTVRHEYAAGSLLLRTLLGITVPLIVVINGEWWLSVASWRQRGKEKPAQFWRKQIARPLP